MIKCKICGHEISPTLEEHYIARDSGVTGLSAAFKKDEEKIYDTFDCPNCGCQAIVQERKRVYCEEILVKLEEGEDDEYDCE